MEVKCQNCGKYFLSKSEIAKCCSTLCYIQRRSRLNKLMENPLGVS